MKSCFVRGFSTLEIVIALSILVLAISAVLLLVPESAYVDSELSAAALARATETLGEQQSLARKDYHLVVATTSSEIIDGIEFTTKVDVERVDFYLERVSVSVSWGAVHNRLQETKLSTLISDFEESDGGDTCDASLTGMWNIPRVSNHLFGSMSGINDPDGLYMLTDIDIHRQRLYATVNLNASPLPSQGPLDSANADTDARTGTSAWHDSGNVRTSDGQYTTSTLRVGERSQFVIARDFGFSIPPGATILGIAVDVKRKNSSTVNTTKDASVRLIHPDGSLGSTDKARSTNWPTSDSYSTYGGSSDVWNETEWSPEVVNDPAFGVAFAAEANAGAGTRTASVDHIRVTVTYTKQFYVLDISHSPILVGGLGQNTVSTGMNAVAIATSTTSGSYAYVAMNSNTTQLEVIDVSSPTAQVVGSYRLPGANAVANTISYGNGYVYLGLENSAASEFAIIDVHGPSSPTLVGTYEIGAGIHAIVIKDGRAYLATDDTHRELVILDIHDPSLPGLIASYDAPGASPGQGKSLAVIGDTLYLGRYYSSNAPEFMSFDVSSSIPLLTNTRDMGASGNTVGVYDVLVRNHVAFALTGNETGTPGKLQLFDLLKPMSDPVMASVSLPNNGVPKALVCEGNTLYAASVPRTGTYTNRGSLSVINPL